MFGMSTAVTTPTSRAAGPGFFESVRADLQFSGVSRLFPLSFVWSLLTSRGFAAVFLYRLGRALRWTRVLPWFCRRLGALLTHASIHETAQIGPGLVLPHATGVVVGRNVRLGTGVYLYSGVVLGPRSGEQGAQTAPTVEDHVHIYPHACVFGDVTIGRCTEIGANSVVLESIPPESVVMPPRSTVFRGLAFTMAGFLGASGADCPGGSS
jgi:serine O-acetyltransferase